MCCMRFLCLPVAVSELFLYGESIPIRFLVEDVLSSMHIRLCRVPFLIPPTNVIDANRDVVERRIPEGIDWSGMHYTQMPSKIKCRESVSANAHRPSSAAIESTLRFNHLRDRLYNSILRAWREEDGSAEDGLDEVRSIPGRRHVVCALLGQPTDDSRQVKGSRCG